MTHYGGRELAAAFRTVRNNTIVIAEEIPEESYGFRAAEGTRTVGQTLTHIALGSGFQAYVHQNRIDSLMKANFTELIQSMVAEESKPRTKAEIVELLKSKGDEFATYVEGLSDAFLEERVGMPPGDPVPTKSRFEMLLSPKEHEMHHRGQLMLVQRMIGLTPHLTRQRQERMAGRSEQARA